MSSGKKYPSVQELLAIWSSNIPLNDCYDVYVSSAILLSTKQHRYCNEWKNISITKDIMNKILSIICYSATSTQDNLEQIKDLRRHAIIILSCILQNCYNEIDLGNHAAIQQAIISRKERLIEALFIFALQDQRSYSNAYEILTVIISVIETIEDLLRIGINIIMMNDIVVKKVNYHNCIEFLLKQLQQDLSYTIPCLKFIIDLSSYVEIDANRTFHIERYSHLIEKLLRMRPEADSFDEHLQLTIKFLVIILCQTPSPETIPLWNHDVPSILADTLHGPNCIESHVTRKDMYLLLILLSSNLQLKPNIRSMFPKDTFMNIFSGDNDNNSDSLLTIMRLEYKVELYCVLYMSDNPFPVYEESDRMNSPETTDDGYIISVLIFIESTLNDHSNDLDDNFEFWGTLMNIFSYLSKYVNITADGTISDHTQSLAQALSARVISNFGSRTTATATSNESSVGYDPKFLCTFYMIAILNVICGIQPFCWQMERSFLPSELQADAELVESKATALLLVDPDNSVTLPRGRAYSLTSDPNKSHRPQQRRASLDITSPIQKQVHDRFLDYDLTLISSSSASWFVDDIDFLSPSRFKSNNQSLKSISESMPQPWKLLYVLICVRYIGLWRLIISDPSSESVHGLDLTNVIESIIYLISRTYPVGYSPICIDPMNKDAYFKSQYSSAVLLTCLRILSMLLRHNSSSNSLFHHRNSTPSSVDHSSYDLPMLMLSPDASTTLFEFCLNSMSMTFKHHRLNIISQRGSSSCGSIAIHLIEECMSTMISLACIPAQTIARREIMRHYSITSIVFTSMDPFQASIPMLVLLHVCNERIPKIPENCEDKIFRLILMALRSGDQHAQMLACDIISLIGEVHPGLIYRVIGRPEIEDQLLAILHNHQCSAQTSLKLYYCQLYSILKACAACVRDINPKPSWMRLAGSYFYHWSIYGKGLRCRRLLHESVITTALDKAFAVISKDNINSPSSIIIVVFAELLAFVNSLMYNCSDGVLASVATRYQESESQFKIGESSSFLVRAAEHEGCNPAVLKDELLTQIIPILPRALNLITLRETLYNASPKSTSPTRNSSSYEVHVISDAASSAAQSSPERQPASKRATIDVPLTENNRKISSPAEKQKYPRSKSNGNLSSFNMKNVHFNFFARQAGSSSRSGHNNHHLSSPQKAVFPDLDYENSNTGGATVISLESTLETSASYQIPPNKALLLLTAKTLDACFAFLCLDEMYPMSTYLRNISIFHHVPLIACVCYTMIRYHSDDFVQKRGIGILKAFAFNQIEISSLSTNAPIAIYTAFKLLNQDAEMQMNCSKIILVIASYDDTCRENLLRYSIYSEILSVILRDSESIDAIVSCCMAITALSQTKRNVYMLTIGGKCFVHEALLELLKKHPTEKRIQIETLRALTALTDNSEYVSYLIAAPDDEGRIKDSPFISTLRRTSRYLTELLRSDNIKPEYSKEDVEKLLHSNILNIQTDNCSIS